MRVLILALLFGVFSYGQDGKNRGGKEIEKSGFGEVIYMS